MASTRTLLVLGLLTASPLGCRGFVRDTGPYESCDPDTLEPGRVRARRLPCDDETIDGGEGRRADYVIENAWARFVIRNPGAPLTLLQGGGGTLIDAAPPGGQDTLAELVPLVGGCWLEQTTLELEQLDDGAAVHITGVPATVDFLDCTLEDDPSPGPVTISYVLGPDDRALTVVGADAFWLVPGPGAELAGATLRSDGVMLGVDGDALDLGGGVLVRGGGRFAAGEPSDVMAALWPGGSLAHGSTLGQGVEVLAGAQVVGWLPVDDLGGFEGTLPAGADGLRALALGHAAGPVVQATPGVELPLGPEGWLGVRVVDRHGHELPGLVTAVDDHGGRSIHPVEPQGSWLGLGGGAWELEVDPGPAYSRVQHSLPHLWGRDELTLVVDGPGPPAGWVLAELDVEAWPSRRTRTAPSLALGRAAARGVGYGVVGAPDEVATADLVQPWDSSLRANAGTWAASDDQGTVVAWPVSSTRRKPAHGAVDWHGLPAEDILRVAAGGDSKQRLLAVDAAWLGAAGPSWGWAPRPDMVRLDGIHQLDLLLGLYDAWVDLTPVGPLTWVWLGHDASFPGVEVEGGLLAGSTVATTGPFLALQVDGVGPGELISDRQPHRVGFEVRAPRDRPLEGAALIVDGVVYEQWDLTGGLEHSRLAVHRLVPSERYVMAVAWGPRDISSADWAVSAPIWTGRPR